MYDFILLSDMSGVKGHPGETPCKDSQGSCKVFLQGTIIQGASKPMFNCPGQVEI